jgi:AcrR family transcriptional regulator
VVYSTFGGLQVLLTALLRREERRAVGQMEAIVPEDPGDRDPDEIVTRGLADFLRVVRENPATWRLVLLPVEGTPELVRRQVQRNRERVLEQFRALVSWGLQRRGGPAGLDEELVARAIMALGEEAGRLVLTDPERFTAERLTGFAERLLLAIRRD